MDIGYLVVFLGIAMMLPFLYYLSNIIDQWVNEGEVLVEPTLEVPDLQPIIDSLHESVANLHTDLESWRYIANEREERANSLEADKVGLEMTIETLRGEVLHQKGRAASAHTTRGQLLEKWTPFVSAEGIEEHWRVEDWQFLGAPIDYVVFDWRQDKVENLTSGKIVLLDVKSGKSQLTSKQRRIRDLIKAGRVEWREIRLD